MSLEFCHALPGAALAADRCIYSDGTPFVTGPPPGVCAASPRPDLPYCGGACAESACVHPNDCLGLSDTRSFGFCGGAAVANCRRNLGSMQNETVLRICRSAYGADCACVVPVPQAEGLDDEIGFAAPRDLCLDYRSHHPDHARCVAADWSDVP